MLPLPYRHQKDLTLRSLAPGWAVPVPSAQRPVRVVSVEKSGVNSALWTFDIPIFEVWDTIVELQASANGTSFVSPTSTSNPTTFQFAATYPVAISVGCIFRLVAQLESMTFLYDNLLVLPQRGVIIPTQPAVSPPFLSMAQLGTQSRTASKKPRKTEKLRSFGSRRAA